MASTTARRPVKSANMNNRRKAMRRKKLMRRKALLIGILLAAVIIIVLIITGIVSLIKGRFSDTTTLKVDSDGTIVMDEVSDFDDAAYDIDELEDDAKKLAEQYNNNNENGKVSLKKVKLKDKTAYLRMQYSDYNTYSNFTGNELFVGTIQEAKGKGYEFADTFSSVDKKEKTSALSSDDMTTDDTRKVVIVRGNEEVVVPGKIIAISDPCTTILDDNKVEIKQPDGNSDATVLTVIMYE